jgi:hypothetical protein
MTYPLLLCPPSSSAGPLAGALDSIPVSHHRSLTRGAGGPSLSSGKIRMVASEADSRNQGMNSMGAIESLHLPDPNLSCWLFQPSLMRTFQAEEPVDRMENPDTGAPSGFRPAECQQGLCLVHEPTGHVACPK